MQRNLNEDGKQDWQRATRLQNITWNILVFDQSVRVSESWLFCSMFTCDLIVHASTVHVAHALVFSTVIVNVFFECNSSNQIVAIQELLLRRYHFGGVYGRRRRQRSNFQTLSSL